MVKKLDNINEINTSVLNLKPNDTLIIKIDLDKYDLDEIEQWLRMWEHIFTNNTVTFAPKDVDFLTISNY